VSYIFISHSSKDKVYARKLVDDLGKHGFQAWIDDSIDYGDRWWRTVVKALLECSAVLVVMTPQAEESDWVEKEILLANKKGKPIFPLLLRGEEFPIFVNVEYVNVLDGRLPPDNFYKRLSRIVVPRISTPSQPTSQPTAGKPTPSSQQAPAVGLLKCPQCGLPFKTQGNLDEHIANWHPGSLSVSKREFVYQPTTTDRLYKCRWCGLPFKTQADLNRHIFSWHPTSQPIPSPSQLLKTNNTLKSPVLDNFKLILSGIIGAEPASISLRSRLTEDLGMDELDYVELIMAVEDDYGIEIPEAVVGDLTGEFKLKTVQDWVNYLSKI